MKEYELGGVRGSPADVGLASEKEEIDDDRGILKEEGSPELDMTASCRLRVWTFGALVDVDEPNCLGGGRMRK